MDAPPEYTSECQEKTEVATADQANARAYFKLRYTAGHRHAISLYLPGYAPNGVLVNLTCYPDEEIRQAKRDASKALCSLDNTEGAKELKVPSTQQSKQQDMASDAKRSEWQDVVSKMKQFKVEPMDPSTKTNQFRWHTEYEDRNTLIITSSSSYNGTFFRVIRRNHEGEKIPPTFAGCPVTVMGTRLNIDPSLATYMVEEVSGARQNKTECFWIRLWRKVFNRAGKGPTQLMKEKERLRYD